MLYLCNFHVMALSSDIWTLMNFQCLNFINMSEGLNYMVTFDISVWLKTSGVRWKLRSTISRHYIEYKVGLESFNMEEKDKQRLFQYKEIFPGMDILIIKITWSHDRLIFITRIPKLARRNIYVEMVPRSLSPLMTDFNHLCHSSVKKLYQMQMYFFISSQKILQITHQVFPCQNKFVAYFSRVQIVVVYQGWF